MTMGGMQSLNYPRPRRMAKVVLNGFRVIRSFSLPLSAWDDPFYSIEPGMAGSIRRVGARYLRLSGWVSKRTPGRPVSMSARMLRWSLPFGLARTA